METVHEDDVLIPDQIPPHFVDFRAVEIEGTPTPLTKQETETVPEKKKRTRTGVKERPKTARKPRKPRQKKETVGRKLKPTLGSEASTDQSQAVSQESKAPQGSDGLPSQASHVNVLAPPDLSTSQMMFKVATALRDSVGFVADKLFRGHGAIQKEFQSDKLLAELIQADMKHYSPLMSNKARIAICSGVDVATGFQKRSLEPTGQDEKVPSGPPALVRQDGFSASSIEQTQTSLQ